MLGSDAPPDPDPRLTRLTVEDLLTMRARPERTSGEAYGRWVSSRNWVRFALARPFVDEPGGAMLPSTGTSCGHPLRFACGYGGQMLFIVPDLKPTVVMTSDPSGARDNGHIAALHALLDDGIVPAAERGGAT
ncbi:hypothetical protein [Sphingomonas sp. S-NIH.Pt15_0812]|uniref:hypothetical protein n=1 Tax=Sphingomonas sp. S-NIH.Pt15_0812 TaxID=1920129 RepID=UPI0019CFB2DA|nr:hypothetical protein [Sphingomonas sp. S-NIH.Pt15_0812]